MFWSQLIYLPSMMLSGMMVPTEILPEVMMRVARLLPATYAMDAFKGMAMGGNAGYDPVWAAVILFAGCILSFGMALYLFSWDSQNPTRRIRLLALLALIPYVLGAVLLPLGERIDLLNAVTGCL